MNRRSFLGASATTAASLAAGCLGVLESDDSGYESVSKWTVPPADDEVSTEGYVVYAKSPSRWQRVRERELPNESVTRSTSNYVWGEVDRTDVERFVEVRPPDSMEFPYYRVFTGSFDADAARERLADRSERHAGTYEGFDVYEDVTHDFLSELPFACGVREGTVIQIGGWIGNLGTPEQVERVADAAAGTIDRFPDQHRAIRDVATQIEPAASSGFARKDPDAETSFSGGRIAGAAAAGFEIEVDGATRLGTDVYVFESVDALDTDVLEEYVSWRESRDQVRSATYDVDGRIATVEYDAPIDRYDA